MFTLLWIAVVIGSIGQTQNSEKINPQKSLSSSGAASSGTRSTDARGSKSHLSDRYTELYDVIFPHQSLELGREQFVLTLRYTLTTRSRDFQYSILRYDDGRMKVVALRTQQSPFSYLDLDYPITTLSEQEFEAVKELVRSIPIERRELELNREEGERLLKGFLAASSPQLKDLNLIPFGGTIYNLSLVTGKYDVNYHLAGETIGGQKFSNPLIQWMNEAHQVLSLAAWNSVSAKPYYVESWKQGDGTINEERVGIRITPQSSRKATPVKSAAGLDKYSLVVSSDSENQAWYVDLIEKGNEKFGNLLRPHNDPHQDLFMPLDGISLLLYEPPADEPAPILSVPFQSTRIIKVESFYCSIQISEVRLSKDRRKLISALVNISFSNKRPSSSLIETEQAGKLRR